MFKMEEAFYELLHNQILYEGKAVEIIQGYSQIDETPCITIQQADEAFVKRRYAQIDNVQYLKKKYSADVWVNIWCNTNKQRNNLIEQVKNKILQAETNHYTTCANYDEGTCNIIEDECLALTENNYKTIKNQCPDQDIYTSFFTANNIKKNSFKINGIFNLDELDIAEPILRTIFKLQMTYSTYYRIGGATFEDIDINGDLL